MAILKGNRDHFAYDISKNVIKDGELHDSNVINQSIEIIISTAFFERVFNLSFGSSLRNYLFEGMTEQQGEKVLDDIIAAIKRYEDRVVVLESQCRMTLIPDSHSFYLTIPYIIKKNNITSEFDKKIIF